MRDQKWISDLKKGKETSLEILVQTYYDDIYRFLYRRVGNRADAEDLTQEVFLKFLKNLHRYRECGKVKNFLLKLAVNAANDFFRKRREERVSREELEELADERRTVSPLEAVLAQEEICLAQRLLTILPEFQVNVILLRIYHDLSFAEIARITDSSVPTVKSRYRQGIEKMRREMEGEHAKR